MAASRIVIEDVKRAEEARKLPHLLDGDFPCPDCRRVTPHRFEYVQITPESDAPDSRIYATTSHTCRVCKQTHVTSVDRSREFPEKDVLRILVRR